MWLNRLSGSTIQDQPVEINRRSLCMTLTRSAFLRTAACALLGQACDLTWADEGFAELAAVYRAQIETRLAIPLDETRRYGLLADEALARAGVALLQPQCVAVVDRNPYVQAFFLFWRVAQGEYEWIGASPVSTGRPGSFDHFETPLGVFEHSVANPDYRAEGTRNSQGFRGYGAKGMRIFDFGWQQVPRGWGNGAVSEMRLQMHATDPDLLEQRLGTVQSKGCIRIPASLNRLLDHYGVLDADYEQTAATGHKQWVLQPKRQPVSGAGRYLLVVQSARSDRPEWSPSPLLPSTNPAAAPARKP
jgi:hypothetical protein